MNPEMKAHFYHSTSHNELILSSAVKGAIVDISRLLASCNPVPAAVIIATEQCTSYDLYLHKVHLWVSAVY